MLTTIIKSAILGLVLGAALACAVGPTEFTGDRFGCEPMPLPVPQRSTQAILSTLVAPGVPNGTPAVMTTRCPG
jgi:hypothetical protein